MNTVVVNSSQSLQDAVNNARRGTQIKVAGGLYPSPVNVVGVWGTSAEPIVLTSEDDDWISGGSKGDPAWGRVAPSVGPAGDPKGETFAFLRFANCRHIIVDGLKLCRFWPRILEFTNCQQITIRNCRMLHGTQAIFAREGCRNFLIEDNDWQQDDSPDHALWSSISWVEAHGGDGGDGTFRHFNGAFVASRQADGEFAIRNNRISDAYNGIRMKGVKLDDSRDLKTINANVTIEGNTFIRIRDNPIEPEGSAWNWHIFHNRLIDCHTWFSFDGVRGGYWYIYGNTGRYETRQGHVLATRSTMGRVLKLSYMSRNIGKEELQEVPHEPWYVFNNSWRLRCPIIGGASEALSPTTLAGIGPDFTSYLTFMNNAFEWCDQEADGIHLCEWIEMIRYYDRHRSVEVVFDFSLTDRRDYIEQARSLKLGERSGISTDGPIFRDARRDDFNLGHGSAGLGSGHLFTLEGPDGRTLHIRPGNDGNLNRGAQQDYGLVQLDGDVSSAVDATTTPVA